MPGSFPTRVRFRKGRFIFKGNSFRTFLCEAALKGFGVVWVGFSEREGEVRDIFFGLQSGEET